MAPVGEKGWATLLNDSNRITEQDNPNFPRVLRDFTQLSQVAKAAQAQTSRLRSAQDQLAASRLFATHGFDPSRLSQDVTSLELQPALEDVFPVESSSVEDYMEQLQHMSVITAIQEAQRETTASFERYIDDCSEKDWAQDKQRLLSIIAPHTGLDAATAGGRLGAPAGTYTAALGQGPSNGLKATVKEKAYIEVVRRLNEAVNSSQSFNAAAEFATACQSTEEKGSGSSMAGTWQLLLELMAVAQRKALQPSAGARFTEALLAGARQHLERGHEVYMRGQVAKHRAQAQRGGNPQPLHDVQAFLSVKLRDKGPLDFQQQHGGGHDTSWIQLFYCLRNGWTKEALEVAGRCSDAQLARASSCPVATALDSFLRDTDRFRSQFGDQVHKVCDALASQAKSRQGQLKYDYMVAVYAIMAGDNAAIERLSRAGSPALSTLEDYMWCKLSLVSVSAAAGPLGSYGMPAYGLRDLQSELNRWPSTYYSKGGKEPLLYATVLLLSLQFRACLRFLYKDDTTKALRSDAVHMAIALQHHGLLDAGDEGETDLDAGNVIILFGRRFLHQDAVVALQYYMAGARAQGNSPDVKAQLLRQLLVESKGYGSLLGGGGGLAEGGAIKAFIPDPQELQKLLEAMAYDCQNAAQLAEAIELFLAAQRPGRALDIISGQMADVIPQAVNEQVNRMTLSNAGADLDGLIAMGRRAVEQAGVQAPSSFTRQQQDVFEQLLVVRDVLLLSGMGKHDMAVQKLGELTFLPATRADAVGKASAMESATMHKGIKAVLGSVLLAAAESIKALRLQRDRLAVAGLREQFMALLAFSNHLRSPQLSNEVYQQLSACHASF